MFIVRNMVTGEAGPAFKNVTKFKWLCGDIGMNAVPGTTHGDEKIYEIGVVTSGSGSEVRESSPAYDVEADVFTITQTSTDPALTDDQKAAFKGQINAAAEAARRQFITPGEGQSMSYREKLSEAKDCLAAYATAADFTSANPSVGTYPLLESEVGIRGANVWKVAKAVNLTFAHWKAIEASINGTRLQAIMDIDGASTVSDAQSIVAALVWPEAI